MNVPVIPDYISPIVAYRVWNWDANQLWSLNGEAWLPGRGLTAKCRKTDHESPADGCSCGVYATKSYQHLQQIITVGAFVHGEVYLWGKVVEHDAGYRAQFAHPKSLVLPSNIDPRLESSCFESLMVYGADISMPPSSHFESLMVHGAIAPNTLLWTKESGYTPAGFDWMAERRKPWCERCRKWHEPILKLLQLGDRVMLLGRGIGFVEECDDDSGCTGDNVRVRLGNNDLYIIPQQDMVWDCGNSRWEADLSRYRGAVILPSSKGWKVLCRPLELKSFQREQSLAVVRRASEYRRPKLSNRTSETAPVCRSQNLVTHYSDADNIDAQNKLHHAWKYLNRPAENSEFTQADADAQSILDDASQTLNQEFSQELLERSLPRGEDR
jgi:hypothetical protein